MRSFLSFLSFIMNYIYVGFFYIIGMILFFLVICVLVNSDGIVKNLSSRSSINSSEYIYLSSIEEVDASLDGKVVFVQGTITAKDFIVEPDLGITVDALGLYTDVSYYQWEEIGREGGNTLNNGENVSYNLSFGDKLIDSSSFLVPHNNTLIFPIESSSFYATNPSLGAYKIAPSIIDALPTRDKLMLDESLHFSRIMQDELLEYAETQSVYSDSILAHYNGEGDGLGLVYSLENMIWLTIDPTQSLSGDIFIEYYYTPEQTVSFFAKVEGDTLHLFANENKAGTGSLVASGKMDIEQFFTGFEKINWAELLLTFVIAPFLMFICIFILLKFVINTSPAYRRSRSRIRRSNVLSALFLTVVTVVCLFAYNWFALNS